MKRYKNKIVITQKEVFDNKKPRYNGFLVGHGVHGDTKYNRNKNKHETKQIIKDYMD